MSVLSLESVLKQACAFEPEVVLRLDASQQNIAEAAVMASCVKVVQINFSHNILSDLAWATSLAQLKSLNLSFNKISDLSPLNKLPTLQELYLEGNNITNITHVANLATLPALRALRLQAIDGAHANPVCADPAYAATCATISSLKILDGHRLQCSLASFSLAPVCSPNPTITIPSQEPLPAPPPVEEILAPFRTRVAEFLNAVTTQRTKLSAA
eukprot:m.74563 g.74563  ORF g.74563 m.74563 type:complete len:214 (+) comp13096_c0_seq1:201-842(+)